MKLFRVEPKPRWADQADGAFTWKLPSFKCPTCNLLQSEWFGYPNLSLQGKVEEGLYQARLVTKYDYLQLARTVESLFPDCPPLYPGTGFGPFRGTVGHGEKRDCLWVSPQKLLLKETAYDQLAESGLRIGTGPAVMEDFKTYQARPEYRRVVDLKVICCMAVQTIEFAEFRNCSECGVRVLKRPERLFLKKKAIPEDLPLFMVRETASIIANEEFAKAVKSLKVKNTAFEPVDLV